MRAARAVPLLAAMLAVALAAPPARAGTTKLEGEYQLMFDLRKDSRAFPWDHDSNDGTTWNPLQLRLFSQPRAGIEAFTRVEAGWRRGDNQSERPEFHFGESHLRFRREMGKRGFDSYLFSRQRRMWVDNYLIRFVDDRDGAQGVRFETWGFLGMNTTWIVGDQSNQIDPGNLLSEYERRYGVPAPFAPRDSLIGQASERTDDFYVVRLRREFLAERKLRLGFTFNRLETWAGRDSVSARSAWKSVMGFDSRLRVGSTDVSLEYGQSFPRFTDEVSPPVTVFRRKTGLHLPERAVIQAEIRSFKFGTARLGYLNVTPGWWMRGPQWANGLGGPGSDETGFNLQSYYLLPERAITYSNQLLMYGSHTYSQNRVREIYNELYVEFVNGFTGKTSYKRRDEYSVQRRRQVRDIYNSWFNEMQVESRLAWLRVQSRLMNIGRDDRKQLFVIEDRINLTEKTKIYSRFALGNDPSRLRKGVFTQLQYRPTGNMEMFLQYGPDYIGGGSNPVEDGNLAGSGDQIDEVKFILKGTF